MSDDFHRRAVLGLAAGCATLAATRAIAAEEVTSLAKHVEPPQAPQTDAVAPLTEGPIAYWDTGGSGEAVLFLHPATGSRLVWGYQQPVFAKSGYRAIGYSRRGYNGSDPVRADRDGEKRDISALMDHLKVDKFHMVGSAGGGITATGFALGKPERVLSLTIASSVVSVRDPDYARVSERLTPKNFNDMPPDFRELSPSYRAMNPDGVARWLELEHISRAKPPANAAAGRGIADNGDITWANLEAMKIPVLLITGDADLYAPPAMLRILAKHLKDVEVQVVQESGHSIYWEQPDTFNKLVLDFIRRHKGK